MEYGIFGCFAVGPCGAGRTGLPDPSLACVGTRTPRGGLLAASLGDRGAVGGSPASRTEKSGGRGGPWACGCTWHQSWRRGSWALVVLPSKHFLSARVGGLPEVQGDDPEHRPCMDHGSRVTQPQGTAFRRPGAGSSDFPASKATPWLHRHGDQAQCSRRGSRGRDQLPRAGLCVTVAWRGRGISSSPAFGSSWLASPLPPGIAFVPHVLLRTAQQESGRPAKRKGLRPP
ncbi:hypothetical protein HJG60_009421 [Phyllostomus discolor]|uniref:Uncharacterized protein n=1 Tax=Phyllostomus discolor TaxID=89673 RepID=A0A833YKS6_9CHIR|nr:hypothetical protein HJG60_009421 [Phyllostomus discolor]